MRSCTSAIIFEPIESDMKYALTLLGRCEEYYRNSKSFIWGWRGVAGEHIVHLSRK